MNFPIFIEGLALLKMRKELKFPQDMFVRKCRVPAKASKVFTVPFVSRVTLLWAELAWFMLCGADSTTKRPYPSDARHVKAKAQ